MWVFRAPGLTALGPGLLVQVDEKVAGTLRTEGQECALHHSRDEGEAQQKGPHSHVAQEGLQAKHLPRAAAKCQTKL